MAFCGKCGTQIGEGVKFCPGCGAPVEAASVPAQAPVSAPAPAQQNKQDDFAAKLAVLNETEDNTADFDAQDIEQNKVMAILAYIGFLFLIPLFAAPKSKFARYHINQGLVLFIGEVAFGIAYRILSALLYAISWRLGFIVSIVGIVSIIFPILAVIGIINAANGRAKELPLIGKIRILR